jgi:hypothetical protein
LHRCRGHSAQSAERTKPTKTLLEDISNRSRHPPPSDLWGTTSRKEVCAIKPNPARRGQPLFGRRRRFWGRFSLDSKPTKQSGLPDHYVWMAWANPFRLSVVSNKSLQKPFRPINPIRKTINRRSRYPGATLLLQRNRRSIGNLQKSYSQFSR